MDFAGFLQSLAPRAQAPSGALTLAVPPALMGPVAPAPVVAPVGPSERGSPVGNPLFEALAQGRASMSPPTPVIPTGPIPSVFPTAHNEFQKTFGLPTMASALPQAPAPAPAVVPPAVASVPGSTAPVAPTVSRVAAPAAPAPGPTYNAKQLALADAFAGMPVSHFQTLMSSNLPSPIPTIQQSLADHANQQLSNTVAELLKQAPAAKTKAQQDELQSRIDMAHALHSKALTGIIQPQVGAFNNITQQASP